MFLFIYLKYVLQFFPCYSSNTKCGSLWRLIISRISNYNSDAYFVHTIENSATAFIRFKYLGLVLYGLHFYTIFSKSNRSTIVTDVYCFIFHIKIYYVYP